MTPRALAGPVLALLGGGPGPVRVAGRRPDAWGRALVAAGVPAAVDAAPAGAAVVSFLGEPGDATARAGVLLVVRAALVADGRLVVVDHNRPRRLLGRWCGLPALWRRGLGAARACYPTAREVAAQGFVVERLALAAGERVQLVLARPRPAAPGIRTT